MILFTSDTHFSHGNIITYCNRPFLRPPTETEKIALELKNLWNDKNDITIPDPDAMNEYLIDRWNSKVNKGDTVYHLGDFGFTPRAKTEGIQRLQKIANRLKGKIILIRGNHDTNIESISRFETVKDIHVIHTNNTRFVLCHYPMRSWQFMNKGSIHLFGHCHANMAPYYKSFDVGVDNAKKILDDYAPFTINEVLDYAKTLERPKWAM